MFFRQIYEEGLAQASYIVGCPETGEALVVDPRRDVDVYLRVANENELKITGVTETHIHADFLSGARELAAATGAMLYVSGEGGNDWSYRNLPTDGTRTIRHDDIINVGDVAVRVLHTPGHTPEHLTFVVSESSRGDNPMIAMTGDFVFVGDVGRPDLLEAAIGVAGSADAGARRMFASLRGAFAAIPDYVQIWPGHGAGSACGKALGAVPASTVGYERLTAWWAPLVAAGEEDRFVASLLDGQPDAPTYFARMKRLNRDGVPILGSLPKPSRLDNAALRKAIDGGALVIDTRESAAFHEKHVRGAISILDESTFATRAGWFVPPESTIVLIAPEDRVDALVRALVRVGLDRIAGFVPADDAPAFAGLPMTGQATLDVPTAQDRWRQGSAFVLDVRSSSEYKHGHIPGAVNVPAGNLRASLDRIPRDRPLIVHCAGGSRATGAASALLAEGFVDVHDVAGGFDAWQAVGNPTETGEPVRAAR